MATKHLQHLPEDIQTTPIRHNGAAGTNTTLAVVPGVPGKIGVLWGIHLIADAAGELSVTIRSGAADLIGLMVTDVFYIESPSGPRQGWAAYPIAESQVAGQPVNLVVNAPCGGSVDYSYRDPF